MKREVEILVCDICKSVYTFDQELINRLRVPFGKYIGTYAIPVEKIDNRIKVLYKEVNICSDWRCIRKAWDIVVKCLEPSSGIKFIEALQREQEESEEQ